MTILEIIAKKRDGGVLAKDEIAFVVQGVTDGSLPDYQVSAWLMAVFLRGMTGQETLDLTLAMRDSGTCIDLSDLPGGPTLDKHSTGGVGDKTTLVVVPLLAAAGVPMLKMSGRGLGFSGGTVDKLESIPGFRSDLTVEEAKEQVRRIGAALIGQSHTLAPADKALYALRDLTATIESVPLIASSIMSKKLASGGQRIVLDVKAGRGAFMKTREEARVLARELVRLGNSAGVPTSAMLTDMEEPLGWLVGNAVEVREAVRILQNLSPIEPRFLELCLRLTAHSLAVVGKAKTETEGRTIAEEILASGRGAAKFAEIIHAQGGPATCEAIVASLPDAWITRVVRSDRAGYVTEVDAEAVGRLAMQMGAGRQRKTDVIKPEVGTGTHVKIGQKVDVGQPLGSLYCRVEDEPFIPEWEQRLVAAFVIEDKPPVLSSSPVLEVID